MKVLVTGGAGFIGYHLSKNLADKGYNVIICDNYQRGKEDKYFKALTKMKNVKIFIIDLTKPNHVEKLPKDFNYVYHLAAINGTEYFCTKPEQVLYVNILSTINLLNHFSGCNNTKILFSSSSEAYASSYTINPDLEFPTKEDIPLSITDVFNPRYSYGGSKLVGELLVINYAKRFGFPYSIIRYHNIYGPRMGYKHVIPEFILRMSKKENPFKIYGGNQTRAFCFVQDAINATISVNETKKTNSEIVHIGKSDEEIEIIDLAKLLFSVTNYNASIQDQSPRQGSVNRRCPNVSKLKELTGILPEVSLKEGLEITYRWYLENAEM